jgi:WD40 repeat protein/predicted Ser/Thr protein kinase
MYDGYALKPDVIEINQCPVCGKPHAPDAPASLCPVCALRDALEFRPDDDPDGPDAPDLKPDTIAAPGRVGDYDLLEEIARGGMGVVFKARQASLGRIVAVKMILTGRFASPDFFRRFRTEAQAAAMLDHPRIVPIYEVSDAGEHPYLVMKLIDGPSLAQALAGKPLPPEQAASLTVQIARAVHHAHQRGVLHRDLKPGNILIDSAGFPHVTDFGLAKIVENESSPTVTRAVLGTAAYMAPEQATGGAREVTTAADVYGLGALLYEMLTGRAPFGGETTLETLRNVTDTDAPRPASINARIDRDLETICLKCLEKDPARRYGTAEALADDLQHWLRSEPIEARPASMASYVAKWMRRRPAVSGLLVALLMVTLAGIAGIVIEWRSAKTLAVREMHARETAEKDNYVAQMNLAQQAWEQRNIINLRQILDATANYTGKGFEWFFWERQLRLSLKTLRGHPDEVSSVAASPDGRWIVSGSDDGAAIVWDAATGVSVQTLRGHSADINSVAWFPDSRRVITGSDDHTAKIWEAATGKVLATINSGNGRVKSVTVSADGHLFATGNQDGTTSIWKTDEVRQIIMLPGHDDRVLSLKFSKDNRFLLTGSTDNTARLWDVSAKRVLRTFTGHSDYVSGVAFFPDEKRVLTSALDNTAKIWDAATAQLLQTLSGHAYYVQSIAISPDGRYIATGSSDRTARIWDANTGNLLLTFNAPTDEVRAVDFSPDGRELITGSSDGIVRQWDFEEKPFTLILRAKANPYFAAGLSADGRFLACGTIDSPGTEFWDLDTARLVKIFTNLSCTRALGFSADGKWLAVADNSAFDLWKIGSEDELRVPLMTRLYSIALSPDGQKVLAGGWSGSVSLWHAGAKPGVINLAGHTRAVTSVAFSPDGRRMLSTSTDGTVRIWDAEDGRELLAIHQISDATTGAFSPDGRRIVTGCLDRTARVWDAFTGRELLSLHGHLAAILSAVFSSDGRRIITASDDETTRLWDAENGGQLLLLTNKNARVVTAGLSADNRRIISVSRDGTVTGWQRDTDVEVNNATNDVASRDRLARALNERQTALKDSRAARSADPGVIRDWLVLLPIPLRTNASAHSPQDEEYLPSEGQLHPAAGERVRVGDNELAWTAANPSDGVLKFNVMLGRLMEHSVAYAVCHIQSQTGQTGLRLQVGSDDQAKVYLNGQAVYTSSYNRSFLEDEDTVEGIQLKPGDNLLVFKVVNQNADWEGSVRLTDEAGQPVNGLRMGVVPQP